MLVIPRALRYVDYYQNPIPYVVSSTITLALLGSTCSHIISSRISAVSRLSKMFAASIQRKQPGHDYEIELNTKRLWDIRLGLGSFLSNIVYLIKAETECGLL